ncbi:MAG: aldehyde dehydrogenase family protein, partial [Candidatus Marinimicrobia bacterium]|nr:aldehyde dehydrogenase family protein [Candidatus Neomarinimicrobiota bacterium]
MTNQFTIPIPVNEPIKDYDPGSPEKASLQAKADELSSQVIDIPLVIGGEEIRTGNTAQCIMPHDHEHVLANFHQASEKEVEMAINASQDAWQSWSKKPLKERAEIYVKIADLLTGPWRDTINAATMLNMSKNVFQAEIDSACEMIDFFRFNPWYAQELASHQPMYSPEPTKNSVELRPLEGFVFAVSPFNFTSIGGNLPSAPALMGNVALWKPASSAVYPAHFIMQLFKEAGLPDGVINFIPGRGSQVGPNVMNSPLLAGVHFTGSTAVFQGMWKHIGKNIQNYKTYPRIVGETGGKDFCLAHESVNKDALVTAMVRGAFEYQGQKCSAMSRAYIPTTIWDDVKEKYLAEVDSIKMGDPKDFTNFMNAVIDRSAFESISEFIDFA